MQQISVVGLLSVVKMFIKWLTQTRHLLTSAGKWFWGEMTPLASLLVARGCSFTLSKLRAVGSLFLEQSDLKTDLNEAWKID
jgi:hypothetical protein